MPKSRSRRSSRRSRRKRRGGLGFDAGNVEGGKCKPHPCGFGSSPGCSAREAKRMELVSSRVAAGTLKDGEPCPKPGGMMAKAGKTLGRMKTGFVLPLVARYVRDLIKPNTMMPKTRNCYWTHLYTHSWWRINT